MDPGCLSSPPPCKVRCRAEGEMLHWLTPYLQHIEFDDTISILVKCMKGSCVEELTGQMPVTGSPYLHSSLSSVCELWLPSLTGIYRCMLASNPPFATLFWAQREPRQTAWESNGADSATMPTIPGRRVRGQEGRSPLTEHALQPDEAADEAVEVDVHVLVCVAHGDDVIELAVEVKPCEGECYGEERERREPAHVACFHCLGH